MKGKSGKRKAESGKEQTRRRGDAETRRCTEANGGNGVVPTHSEHPTSNAEYRRGGLAASRTIREPELAAKEDKDRHRADRKTEGGIVLPPEERFFTKPELAKVLKVSVRCITDMMRRGEIRYLKINGHLVRFRLQDVNQRLSETVLCCEGTEGSETRRHGDAETGKREGGHGVDRPT